MGRLRSAPVAVLAALVALVAVVSANLSGLGIGARTALYDPYALPRLAVALALVPLAWALWTLVAAREARPLRVDAAWLALVALAAWGALSTAVSPHRVLAVLGQSERLEGLVTLLLYAAVYGVALQAVRHVADVRRIAVALCAAAVLLAVMGVLQRLGLGAARYALEGYAFDTRRAFATFGDPDLFAGLLVLAFPVCLGIAIDSRHRAAQVSWSLAGVLVASALFLTFSYGAWIAAVAQAVAGAIVWRRTRPSASANVAVRVFVTVGGVALVILLGLSFASRGDLNLATSFKEATDVAGSSSERVALVAVSGSAIAQRPLTGWGPDSFLPAFRASRSGAYAATFGDESVVDNAHSWPIQYAVTLGVPGALLLLAALWLALARSRGVLRPPGGARAGAATMASVWVGCAGFAVSMLGGVAGLGATLPFWILLGAIAAPRAREVATPRALHRAGVAVSVAVTLVLAASAVSLVVADRTYLLSRDAFHDGDSKKALSLAESAARLNPVSVKYARGACQVRSRQTEEAIAAARSGAEVRVLYVAAADSFGSFLARNPDDYPARTWLAALRARVGHYIDDSALRAKARQSARRAASLDRQHPEIEAMVAGDTSGPATARAAAVVPLP